MIVFVSSVSLGAAFGLLGLSGLTLGCSLGLALLLLCLALCLAFFSLRLPTSRYPGTR